MVLIKIFLGVAEIDLFNSLLKAVREKLTSFINISLLINCHLSFAPEFLFNLPMQTKKIEKMRYCELMQKSGEKIQFLPALITQTYNQLVFVHIDSNKFTHSKIYSIKLVLLNNSIKLVLLNNFFYFLALFDFIAGDFQKLLVWNF